MKKPDRDYFTPEERAMVDRVKRERNDLDMDSLLRHAVSALSGIGAEAMAAGVISIFETMAAIAKEATGHVVRDSLTRGDYPIDRAIDMLGEVYLVAEFCASMAEIVRRVSEPDDENGPVGLLTPDAVRRGRVQEEARLTLVRARGERDRRRTRGT